MSNCLRSMAVSAAVIVLTGMPAGAARNRPPGAPPRPQGCWPGVEATTTHWNASFLNGNPDYAEASENTTKGSTNVLTLSIQAGKSTDIGNTWSTSSGLTLGAAAGPVSASLGMSSGNSLAWSETNTFTAVWSDAVSIPYGRWAQLVVGSYSIAGAGDLYYVSAGCKQAFLGTWAANVPNKTKGMGFHTYWKNL